MGIPKFGSLSCALMLLLGPAVAGANGITVSETADELNSDGDCSLREAVRSANTDSSVDACNNGTGSDVILLPAGTYQLSRTGTEAGDGSYNDLDLTGETTIWPTPLGTAPSKVVIRPGPNYSSSAPTGEARAFQARTGPNYPQEFRALTIEGFRNKGAGGALDSSDDLTLNKVVMRDNATLFGGTGGLHGGAVYQGGGTLTVKNSSFVGNRAANSGGALHLNGVNTIELRNSTFSRNYAVSNGGAIEVWSNPATLDNVTLVNNSAGGDGGALDDQNNPANTIRNTIIAGNRAGGSGPDCSIGSATSGDYNLVGDPSGCGALTGGSNVVDTEARLAASGRYDGPTPIRPPLTASPAIDAGSCTDSASSDISSQADQRNNGATRNADGDGDGAAGCDIGAVERQKPAMQVDATGDTRDQNPGDGTCMDASGDCTLRAAIDEANADPGLDEIVLPEGTIRLTRSGTGEGSNARGDLDVLEAAIVRGQGADVSTIDADGLDRVLSQSDDFTLALARLTLTGGRSSGSGAGGAIYSNGELRLRRVRVTGNRAGGSASYGGGAILLEAGPFPERDNYRIVRSTFDNNGSNGFGVISANGNRPANRLIDTTVTGNSADGAVFQENGSARIEHSTLVANQGAQIGVDSGTADTVAVHASIVAGSSAPDCRLWRSGTVTSLGDNLEDGTSCGFSKSSDKQNATIDLAALADVGGPMPLRVPNSGSDAVDAGTCATADGYILPRRAFGGSRPQDADGDGTYDCDIGAAERQEVQVSAGPQAPSARTVDAGATGVVMAQLRLANDSYENLDGRKLTLRASGSGDEAADVKAVRLYVDSNGDGKVGSGDTQVDSAKTFGADDGTVTFDLSKIPSPMISSRGHVDLLVVYDFQGKLAALGLPGDASTARAGALPLGMVFLAGLLGLAFSRRGRWLLVPVMVLGLTACGGGGGGGGGSTPSAQTETFAVAADSLQVNGSTGGDLDIRVAPVSGSTVTVKE